MNVQVALLELHPLLSVRSALVPALGLAMCGLGVALSRGASLGVRNPFRKDSASLMNFAKMGSLQCVCGSQHPAGMKADRRQFCRNCGCEVVAQNTELLNKQLTQREIKAMTRSLRTAAIRASHLELPPSVTTIAELHLYLASSEPKQDRNPPPPPSSLKQPQVH